MKDLEKKKDELLEQYASLENDMVFMAGKYEAKLEKIAEKIRKIDEKLQLP